MPRAEVICPQRMSLWRHPCHIVQEDKLAAEGGADERSTETENETVLVFPNPSATAFEGRMVIVVVRLVVVVGG